METSAPIVVGIDYSPASRQALEAAIRTAKKWGAEIELVHALSPLGAPGLDLEHPPFDPLRNESADISASLPRTPQAWLQHVRDAGVPAKLVTRPGPAAQVIVEEAKRTRARAIVVGSHGRTGIQKAILGSVAQKVVDQSPVPVMVVPADGSGVPAA